MRTFTALLVIVILLSLQWRDTLTYISFRVNQERIAREMCINRFSPELMCGGSCVLAEQLEENNRTENEDGLPPALSNHDQVVFLQLLSTGNSFLLDGKEPCRSYHYQSPVTELCLPGVFRPPIAG